MDEIGDQVQGLNVIDFGKAILVVAHPDDEILWFSSIVGDVAKVLISFLALESDSVLTHGRKKALADYPLAHISCLRIKESNVFNDENWREPRVTDYGLLVKGDQNCTLKYKDNYTTLHQILKKELVGYDHVFTHNPWGEYGHEDHVQLFRVIKTLKKDLKFNLWYPGYVSNKSEKLFSYLPPSVFSAYESHNTQPELARKIKALYEKNGCWTWYADWQWPAKDYFIKDNEPENKHGAYGMTFPLNWIYVKITPPKSRKTGLFRRLPTEKVKKYLKTLATN